MRWTTRPRSLLRVAETRLVFALHPRADPTLRFACGICRHFGVTTLAALALERGSRLFVIPGLGFLCVFCFFFLFDCCCVCLGICLARMSRLTVAVVGAASQVPCGITGLAAPGARAPGGPIAYIDVRGSWAPPTTNGGDACGSTCACIWPPFSRWPDKLGPQGAANEIDFHRGGMMG
eukprot:COSAG05_NODE_1477_length_4781_cov_6.449381_4_plen_178_part_00